MPPSDFKPRKDNYKNLEFTIPNPIEQIINGNSGIYEAIFIQREKRSLSRYRKLVQPFDKIVEGKNIEEIEKLVIIN